MNESVTIDVNVYTDLIKKNAIYETFRNLLIDNTYIPENIIYPLFGLDKKKD